MPISLTDCIPATDHRSRANILALSLAQIRVFGGAGLFTTAVIIAAAFFSQDTDVTSAFMEAGTLIITATLWHTFLVDTNLVAQTVSN